MKKKQLFRDTYFFYDHSLNYKKNFKLQKKIITISNNWSWPIKNLTVQNFSSYRINNDQGIEFFGLKGQPVFAASSGEVLYVGNSFKNYGQLIIIKHNKNYLTVYGCNQFVFVHQKQKVYKNQKIATIGLSNSSFAKLYFEIRYKGEPINPLSLLPNK